MDRPKIRFNLEVLSEYYRFNPGSNSPLSTCSHGVFAPGAILSQEVVVNVAHGKYMNKILRKYIYIVCVKCTVLCTPYPHIRIAADFQYVLLHVNRKIGRNFHTPERPLGLNVILNSNFLSVQYICSTTHIIQPAVVTWTVLLIACILSLYLKEYLRDRQWKPALCRDFTT